MSFQDFFAAIKSPDLRRVALHWDTARNGRRMPGWKDIDPSAIAPFLPIVWSWKYDSATDTFTGRLAGDSITEAFGESLRGKPMKEFFRGRQYEMLFARHKRVVSEPAFAHGTGPVFIHAGRYGQGERIIMPLASDGIHGDGLFGATIYAPNPAGPPNEAQRQNLVTEAVDFFPLD
ncbi:MAG: PAS domain-containing protein [Alphaproteobacteria bacterium]|nr:PAS domain-containing protein [Alphaproteobacteria bacterium]MDE1968095.1 PAS domain-containing protein [Alphaproteobacteria bacterium]